MFSLATKECKKSKLDQMLKFYFVKQMNENKEHQRKVLLNSFQFNGLHRKTQKLEPPNTA